MCLRDFLVLFFLTIKFVATTSDTDDGFIFNGSLELSGVAEVRTDGLFRLTNSSTFQMGHAFYSAPFRFKNSSTANASSFSTTFVFAILLDSDLHLRGHGMAFVLSPSKLMRHGVSSAQNLGLFNHTNNGDPNNHIVAVELNTFQNQEYDDIDHNHVGIDINGLRSAKSASAGYVDSETGEWVPVDISSGDRIQLWVEYDGIKHQLNVTLSPIHISKPKIPLLSLDIDLSPIILDQMYVGFSSSTGKLVSSQYVLGWSFKIDGKAEELDLAKLPSLPGNKKSRKKQIVLSVALSSTGVILLAIIVSVIVILVRKKDTFTEILEDWEVKFGPQRFAFKDLDLATKGFNKKELLGQGGFGQVFKGELPVSKNQIAVKRISHNSDQGMKEFIAEIGTIGRLRHPNLARLLGYCRGKDKLLLVYDYMPNGSLDKFLHNKSEVTLNWNQRYSIIKDVASALAYLHEEWVEVIIHRDIKASNVLLDANLNGKLGDFGLARCRKHAQDPETTHVAGTFGYMAPELAKTGRANTSTDVYAFGVFCLEVVCGRRPIKLRASDEEVNLVDWVCKCWKEGNILKTADSKLENDFKVAEIDLVLKLGLLCSHNVASVRPRMSQIVLYLSGQASVPKNLDAILQTSEFVEESINYSAAWRKDFSAASVTITESFLSRGR